MKGGRFRYWQLCRWNYAEEDYSDVIEEGGAD
jgi:hypothetical protein